MKTQHITENRKRYDPYNPEDKKKILIFEKTMLEWYERNPKKKFEDYLEERNIIRQHKNLLFSVNEKSLALFEDLWALWNGYNYLGWIRERAARLEKQSIENPDFIDEEIKKEIDVSSMFS